MSTCPSVSSELSVYESDASIIQLTSCETSVLDNVDVVAEENGVNPTTSTNLDQGRTEVQVDSNLLPTTMSDDFEIDQNEMLNVSTVQTNDSCNIKSEPPVTSDIPSEHLVSTTTHANSLSPLSTDSTSQPNISNPTDKSAVSIDSIVPPSPANPVTPNLSVLPLYYKSTATIAHPHPSSIPPSPSPLPARSPSVLSSTSDRVDDATEKRIDRILEYLRSVEEGVGLNTVIPDPNLPCPQLHHQNVTPPPGQPRFDSNSSATVFDGVKAKIIGQQLEIEEKSRTLSLMKTELKKLKELNKEQANQSKKELKSKLTLQRKEYETIVKRHLGFIDKLLAEKEELAKKCETLSDEFKGLEKVYKDKIQNLQDVHSRELKSQKQLWENSEKIKREKWMNERSKVIKEQTVKGLEPEIQRMIAQHKQQMAVAESKHKEDLRNEKEMLMDMHQRQMEQFRDKLIAERQKACEEEREFARQRYQKQLEREEMEVWICECFSFTLFLCY
ncbi:hypothetical protein BKA69DRAFT_819130 [Paraphysoderma sedebokerense]|nr:hypothetical protein BKA69DRAFT_819130 [Paraphysoderma sedebokerense]